MKKQILNVGTVLNKVEQKSIKGGLGGSCVTEQDCRLSPLYSGGPVACIQGGCSFAWSE
ncbi:hypothetical protein [Polaribacter sp.]